MCRIQTDRVLPPELCIQSIDDILYSIGLCHHSVREIPERSLINKPLIITIVLIIQLMLRIVSNTTDIKLIILFTYSILFIGHLIGIKELFNITFALISIIILLSQMVYYYNHSIGVKPTFIRVIQVFPGSITPSSVGLNNSTQVKQLLKIAKWQPLLKKNNMIILPFICLLSIFITHLTSLDFISSLIYFIYPAIFYSLWCYFCINLLSTQILIFYILCKYFLIKLKEMNRLLKEKKRINTNRIRNILRSFNALYIDLNEFNSTCWSKFLLIIWLLFGIIIILFIFIIIFTPIVIGIKIAVLYFTFLYSFMYIFILSIASSVNSEVNKSYNIFNSFYIIFRNKSKLNIRRLVINQLKVSIFMIINLKISYLFQINTTIERLSKKNIGFTCWALFTVTYFKFYEVNNYLHFNFLNKFLF